MSNKSKVLDFWLSCIREQDIQKTSLDNNVNSHQLIPLDDDGVLLSNQRDSVRINLSSHLRDILKRERTRQLYKNNKDSRPVFFFPLVLINGQSMPLFYVDLTDLEDRIISNDGDIAFEINPWSLDTKIGVVSDTFVKLGYDEENIDLGDSVISFIEKITGQFTLNFQLALKELLHYIQKESQQSSNPYTKVSEIKNIGIIKYSDFSEATLVFKKDLLFIKDNTSLNSNTLIESYISKRSKGIEFVERPFVGGFFDFPVSKGQSIAISEVVEGDREIVSVQGGPGTGKTTLILSVIASLLTKRAISIAKGDDTDNGFYLVTSFTNKAVENVANIIESEYGSKFTNWLYIQLGNREKRTLASKRIQAFHDQISTEHFDRSLYEKLKAFLVSAEASIKSSSTSIEENEITFSPQEKNTLIGLGYSGSFDSKSVKEHVLKITKTEAGGVSSATSSINYSIKSDRRNIEKLSINKIIIDRKMSFYQELIATYPSVDKNIVYGRAPLSSCPPKGHSVPSKMSAWRKLTHLICRILNKKSVSHSMEDLDVYRNEVKVDDIIKEKGIEPFDICLQKLHALNQRIEKLEKRLERKKYLREIIRKLSSSTSEYSSLEKSRLVNVADNKSIFEASLHFIHQHMLKNKTDISDSILSWDSVLQGKGTENHNYHNNFSQFISYVSLPFPVLCCTLSSLGNIFDKSESTFINDKPFEIAICDEAGMVPIYCMPSILMRSKKALVIGDQKQLPPIISIDKNRIQEFMARHKLHDEGGIYSPTLSSAFQRSAFAYVSNFSDIGESVILDEHRRCQPAISKCFIDIGGYTNVSNHTPDLDDEDLLIYQKISQSEIAFLDVSGKGNGRRNCNIAEIERISRLLDEMEDCGIDIRSQVGIITPFQNQSALLLNEFRKKLGHSINSKKIGTVHAFQGSEFDIIILSLVAFNDSFHVQFISNSPNLLNVAVSRAKNRLIVVGDKDFISNQKGNLGKIIAHSS